MYKEINDEEMKRKHVYMYIYMSMLICLEPEPVKPSSNSARLRPRHLSHVSGIPSPEPKSPRHVKQAQVLEEHIHNLQAHLLSQLKELIRKHQIFSSGVHMSTFIIVLPFNFYSLI